MRALLELLSILVLVNYASPHFKENRRHRFEPRRIRDEPNIPKWVRPNSPKNDFRRPDNEPVQAQVPHVVLDRLQGVKSTTDFLKAFGGEKFLKKPEEVKKPSKSKGPQGKGPSKVPGRKTDSGSSELLTGASEDESGVDFENQYCSPRPAIVHVAQPNPSEGIIYPFCIKLQRCQGCCGIADQTQHCAPIRWKNVSFTAYKVSWSQTVVRSVSVRRPAERLLEQTEVDPIVDTDDVPLVERDRHPVKLDFREMMRSSKRGETHNRLRRAARNMQQVQEVQITMATHAECGCQCTLDPSKCGPRQKFVEKNCRCECKAQERCPADHEWDDQSCQCVCRDQIGECKRTMYWDREICACKCWVRRCKKGKVQDPKTCRCVYKRNI
uniref:Toxin candidate TRINITY_DN9564_c1_g1_i1 n=1 Tax=Isarachnanthus nocturnus TaxID=1240238 RepID=A0A7G7WZ74_9CNID|nr:toxin candidate TRINITY_DN9564_c1_g1_i1 [Isarachnanthus nocturnus]